MALEFEKYIKWAGKIGSYLLSMVDGKNKAHLPLVTRSDWYLGKTNTSSINLEKNDRFGLPPEEIS